MAMIMARRDLLPLFNGAVVPADIFLSFAITALITLSIYSIPTCSCKHYCNFHYLLIWR